MAGTDRSRLLLVSNRSSGRSDDDTLRAVESALRPLGTVAPVAPESLESFGAEVSAAAGGAELVVVAGGDGTFNAALNALADRPGEVVFGLVPMGTGNDLARTLGLPPDPLEAAVALANGSERTVDVWRASGPGVSRLFVNACMGGFPVEVNRAIDEDLKKRVGPLAFWVGGAKVASDLTRYEVTMNGVEIPHCLAAGVGNGRTCGGGIEVWPEADPSDGLLEGCGLPAEGVGEAIALAAALGRGAHRGLDRVRMLRAGRIELEASPAIEFNCDGELVGLKSPASFEGAGRITVRVP